MPGRRDVEALARIADSLEALERRQLDAERALAAARRELRDRDPLRTPPPRRLGWRAFLSAIPGLAAQFRPLPAGYAERDGSTFTVKCPCGRTPTVDAEHSTVCDCERVFLASDTVYVANSPVAPALVH